MGAKRRKIVGQDLDLGNEIITIPTDSGGTRTATRIGLETFTGHFGDPIVASSVIHPHFNGKNFYVTGTTAIVGCVVSDRVAGWEFRLFFTSTGTITHNGSPSSGVKFMLSNSTSFTASSSGTSIVECLYDGSVIQANPTKVP